MSKAAKARGSRKAKGLSASGRSKEAANARKARFVEEYVTNGGNGTMAAIAVGYAEKTAYSQASRLLKNVEIVTLIKKRRAALQRRYELTTEDCIQKLAAMVHLDVSELYDEAGNLKPVHLWPADAASCVQAIEAGPHGVVKVKTIGRLEAVVTAMKHLGLFEKDNRQKTDPISQLMQHIAEHDQGFPVRP